MKHSIHRYTAVYISTLLALSACGSDSTGDNNENTVEDVTLTIANGESVEITESASYDVLIIEEDASVTAPEGKSLTLTVDSVETAIASGEYSGDVVLSVTDSIPVVYSDSITNYFRTAVYIEDGAYVAEKSVSAALAQGEVDDATASDLVISSTGANFNGIVVTSSAESTSPYDYLIDSPTMDFTGNGGNDFSGYGAAIMSSGYANVQVTDAVITTNGAIRTAVFVGGNSTMTVNNAVIETYNGTLPEDYTFNVDLGRMMEAPWMLGITGNVRSTNLVGNGTAYYINSVITSQGWGVLSTDDTSDSRLYCINSDIKTIESGYGAYSIGNNLDYFSGCNMDVVDYGVIMAAPGDTTFTDSSYVKSARIGVMLHSGTGELRIENGTVFETQEAVIQAKSSFPTIVIDNATLVASNNVLLEMIENDDPYGAYLQSLNTGSESGGGNQPPEGGDASQLNDGGSSSELVATLSDVTLTGDIINGNTANGSLSLTLEGATLTGAITTSEATPGYLEFYDDAVSFFTDVLESDGYVNYNLIGKVVHEYTEVEAEDTISVFMDSTSSWTVTTTSYISSLNIEDGATLSALDGMNLTLLVDGVQVDIEPGMYSGKLTLQVTDSE